MKNIKTDTFNSKYEAATAEQMIETGRILAGALEAGAVIALSGPLGAGKTTLVKGIAEGLGITEAVTSPSFTIIKEYHQGRLPLYHMDLYRIGHEEELYLLGVEELLYGSGVSIIEWSEKAGELLPADRLLIKISINPDSSRTVNIEVNTE